MDDVDNPKLDIDDENVAWSKNEVARMLQVGDIAVIKADDPFHLFYLLRVTRTVHTLGYGVNKMLFRILGSTDTTLFHHRTVSQFARDKFCVKRKMIQRYDMDNFFKG